MQPPDIRALRTVRSTSYNNEIAAELLCELSSCNVSEEQARRIRCAARQLLRDADALEGAYQQMASPHH
ncbi:MAG: hypothetical protein CTR55_17425 [Pseudomonas sp.]|uniref:hypothetical protein n=1 Tax=Pseudomonas sp. TaxID=306 RepID=UPI000CBF1FB7|nr:hypothetical protein [Pseudomonas sp.]PJI47820.1 MAG: hypothetical protein CTR55_17425 [Pseudomonas sp.]